MLPRLGFTAVIVAAALFMPSYDAASITPSGPGTVIPYALEQSRALTRLDSGGGNDPWAITTDVWGVSPLSFGDSFFVEGLDSAECAADSSGLVDVVEFDQTNSTRRKVDVGGDPIVSWDGRKLAYLALDCTSLENDRAFRIGVRDLVTGERTIFRPPADGVSGPDGLVEPVSWSSDSRHLLVRDGYQAAYQFNKSEYWMLDTSAPGPEFDGTKVAAGSRPPLTIAALGRSGKWVAAIPSKNRAGLPRIVIFDIESATPGRSLFRAKDTTRDQTPQLASNPAGTELLVVTGGTAYNNRDLYRVRVRVGNAIVERPRLHRIWQHVESAGWLVYLGA